MPYLRLKTRLESLRDDRRFSFMFSDWLAGQDALSQMIGLGVVVTTARGSLSVTANHRARTQAGEEEACFRAVRFLSYSAAAGWASSSARCATAAAEGSPSPAICTVG